MFLHLSSSEFDKTYPVGNHIGEGVYGKVYRSGDYAVKVINGDNPEQTFESLIRELDMYSKVDHPCVAKLNNWTITQPSKDGKISGKMALPLGQCLRDVKLPFEKVVGDILSGLEMIHSLSAAHNDIKVENCIYHAGYVQLIDFGLVSHIIHYRNQSVSETPIYTSHYRDPELYFDADTFTSRPIDQNVELYSVGIIALQLFTNFRSFPAFPTDNFTTKNKRHDQIIRDLIQSPLKNRKSISQLFSDYPELIRISGYVLETPVIHNKNNCSQPILSDACFFVYCMARLKKNKVRTLFNAIHNIHRSLDIILPDYVTNPEQKQMVLVVAGANLFLSQIVCQDDTFRLDELAKLLNRNPWDLLLTTIRLVEVLHGIVNIYNQWDYANCLDDLCLYFLDSVGCDYNPSLIRPNLNTTNDKNIKLDLFDVFLRSQLPFLTSNDLNNIVSMRYPVERVLGQVQKQNIDWIVPPPIRINIKQRLAKYLNSSKGYEDRYTFARDLLSCGDQLRTDPDAQKLTQNELGDRVLKNVLATTPI